MTDRLQMEAGEHSMSRSVDNSSTAIDSSLLEEPIVTPEQRREEIRRVAREDARRAVASVRDALIEELEPVRRQRSTHDQARA